MKIKEIVRRLKSNDPGLDSLDLNSVKINIELAKELGEALKQNKILTRLDLCNCELGTEGTKVIIAALEQNKTLRSLDLSYNRIGYEGVEAISEFLRQNKTLTILVLGYNQLGLEGTKLIAIALEQNKTLVRLDLWINLIGPEEVKLIATALKYNATLTSLDLCLNNIGSEGAKIIASMLRENKALTALCLSHNQIDFEGMEAEGMEAIAEALECNTTLVTLDLGDSQIDYDKSRSAFEAAVIGISGVMGNSRYNKISDELKNKIFDYISRNKFFRYKQLNQLQNRDTSLTSVNLKHSYIGPETAKVIVEVLRQDRTLTTLDLSDNPIDSEAAKTIAEALKHNTILTNLHLGNNQISHESENEMFDYITRNKFLNSKKFKQLQNNDPSLISFDLRNNQIGPEGARMLVEALKCNTVLVSLNFWHNQISYEATKILVEALKHNTTLVSLEFWGNQIDPEGTKVISEVLKHNTTLTNLDLGNNQIGSEGAKAIAEALEHNTTLIELNLDDNEIGYHPALLSIKFYLARNLKIRNQFLESVQKAIDQGLAESSKDLLLKKIKTTPINSQIYALEEIVKKTNPKYQNPKFSTTTNNLYIEIIKFLANNQVPITPAILAQAKQNPDPAITALVESLHKSQLEEIARVQRKQRLLQSEQQAFHLESEFKSQQSIMPIIIGEADSFVDNSRSHLLLLKKILRQLKDNDLTELDLRDHKIGSMAVKAIVEALNGNHSLTILYLRNNQIDCEAAKAIAKVLKHNITLTTIDLRINRIGFEGARAIALAMKQNTTLTELDLWSNAIDRELEREILDYVARNKLLNHKELKRTQGNNLIKFNFSGKHVGPEAAKVIAKILKQNIILIGLDLGVNHLGLEGAKIIAEAIKDNTILTELSLGENNLHSEGATVIAEELKHNNAIVSLDLSWNKIGLEGVIAVAEAIKQNKILTNLNIYKNILCSEGSEAIAEAIRQNPSLMVLNLGHTNISSKAIKVIFRTLKRNKTLISLNLDFDEIDFESAKELAEALSQNTTLTSLSLDNTNIGPDGIKEIAQSLRYNKTLTSLSIFGSKIDSEALEEIAKAMEHNITLCILDFASEEINDHPSLSLAKSYLERNCKMRDEFLKLVCEAVKHGITQSCKDLLIKEIRKVPITHQIYALEEIIKETKAIYYNFSSITINSYTKMIEFLVHNEVPITLFMLTEAKSNPDPQILRLIKSLYEFQSEKFARQQKEFLMQSEQRASHLESAFKFQQSIMPIITGEADNFVNNSGDINDERSEIIASFLTDDYHLTSLDLSNNPITDQGADAIINALKASAIKGNHNLTSIKLDKKQISPALIQEIKQLTDANQQIEQDFITAVVANNHQLLEQLLITHPRSPKHLEQLYLIAIANDYRLNIQNIDLTEFDLIANESQLEAVIHLIHTKLITDYPDYQIDQEQLAIANAKAKDKQIAECKNHFHLLLTGVRYNQLSILDLSNYYLSNQEIKELAEAIKTNSSITTINLCNNNITDDGAKLIAEALSSNRSIIDIELFGNDISDKLTSEIDQLLSQNQQLHAKTANLRQVITEIAQSNYQDQQFQVIQLNKSAQKTKHYLTIASIELAPDSNIITINCRTTISHQQILQQIQIIGSHTVLYKISKPPKPFEVETPALQDLSLIQNLITNFTQILTKLKQTELAHLTNEIRLVGATTQFGEQSLTHLSENIIFTDNGVFMKQGPLELAVTVSQLDTLITEATKAKDQLTIASEYKEFLDYLLSQAKSYNGIVFGSEISSLYLEGEQSIEQRQKITAKKRAINANERSKSFYLEFQSQFNSILRLMQSMNISNADRQVAIGQSRKEKFLGFVNSIMEYLPIPEEASVYVKIGQGIITGLLGKYEQKQYERSCVKISNLQGNGEYHIGLLSESLARIIVTDQELIDKVATEIATKQSESLAAKILDKIIHAPTMANRIAENKLSELAKEVIYFSTAMLEAIFDDKDFAIERKEINLELVHQLHQMLRKKMGLEPFKDNKTEVVELVDGSKGTSGNDQASSSNQLAFFSELTKKTRDIQQQLELLGVVLESEGTGLAHIDQQVTISKQAEVRLQYALTIADLQAIKLKSVKDQAFRLSEEYQIPFTTQIDALIEVLIKLDQLESKDVINEIKTTFYHQIKITDPNYIQHHTIQILIQDLVEVRANAEGANFEQFRQAIIETGDVKNFLLNLTSHLKHQTVKTFSPFVVYNRLINDNRKIASNRFDHSNSLDLKLAELSQIAQDPQKTELVLQLVQLSAVVEELRARIEELENESQGIKLQREELRSRVIETDRFSIGSSSRGSGSLVISDEEEELDEEVKDLQLVSPDVLNAVENIANQITGQINDKLRFVANIIPTQIPRLTATERRKERRKLKEIVNKMNDPEKKFKDDQQLSPLYQKLSALCTTRLNQIGSAKPEEEKKNEKLSIVKLHKINKYLDKIEQLKPGQIIKNLNKISEILQIEPKIDFRDQDSMPKKLGEFGTSFFDGLSKFIEEIKSTNTQIESLAKEIKQIESKKTIPKLVPSRPRLSFLSDKYK
jgi:Ran GTPase-activating protein (RanGAP) involved in mRNA processing and transport